MFNLSEVENFISACQKELTETIIRDEDLREIASGIREERNALRDRVVELRSRITMMENIKKEITGGK